MSYKWTALAFTTATLALTACGQGSDVAPTKEQPIDDNYGHPSESCISPDLLEVSRDTNRPDFYDPRDRLCIIPNSGAALERAHAAYQPHQNTDSEPTPTYKTKHSSENLSIVVDSSSLPNYPLGIHIDRVALDRFYPLIKKTLNNYGIVDNHTYTVIIGGAEKSKTLQDGSNVTLYFNPKDIGIDANNEANARDIDPLDEPGLIAGLHSTRIYQELVFSILNVNVKSPQMMEALMKEIFSNSDGANLFVLELPSEQNLKPNYRLKIDNLLKCGAEACQMPSKPPLLKGVGSNLIMDPPVNPQQPRHDDRVHPYTGAYVKRADRPF